MRKFPWASGACHSTQSHLKKKISGDLFFVNRHVAVVLKASQCPGGHPGRTLSSGGLALTWELLLFCFVILVYGFVAYLWFTLTDLSSIISILCENAGQLQMNDKKTEETVFCLWSIILMFKIGGESEGQRHPVSMATSLNIHLFSCCNVFQITDTVDKHVTC